MDRGGLVLDGLPTVLGFRGRKFRLLLYFGFKSGLAVGVNRFLCEVVGSAASWTWKWVLAGMGSG
jgi:hypothetical protein